MYAISEKSSELRVRRAGVGPGYLLRKSRRAIGSPGNHGAFMLVDSQSNFPVAGFCYDMSAEEALTYLSD